MKPTLVLVLLFVTFFSASVDAQTFLRTDGLNEMEATASIGWASSTASIGPDTDETFGVDAMVINPHNGLLEVRGVLSLAGNAPFINIANDDDDLVTGVFSVSNSTGTASYVTLWTYNGYAGEEGFMLAGPGMDPGVVSVRDDGVVYAGGYGARSSGELFCAASQVNTTPGNLQKKACLHANGSAHVTALVSDIRTVSGNTTLDGSAHTVLANAASAGFTVTLPACAQSEGLTVVVKKVDSSGNAVTVDGAGSDTIDGSLSEVLSVQWQTTVVQCDGTAWYTLQ